MVHIQSQVKVTKFHHHVSLIPSILPIKFIGKYAPATRCQRMASGLARSVHRLTETHVLRDSWTKLNVALAKIMQVNTVSLGITLYTEYDYYNIGNHSPFSRSASWQNYIHMLQEPLTPQMYRECCVHTKIPGNVQSNLWERSVAQRRCKFSRSWDPQVYWQRLHILLWLVGHHTWKW